MIRSALVTAALALATLLGALLGTRHAGARGDDTTGKGPPGNGQIRVENCAIRLVDEVRLATDRPGIIGAINIREGARVEAGAPLIALRDEVAQAILATAEKEAASDIEIRFARKAAEVAEVEYRKAAEANSRVPGTVPETEIQRARLAHERALIEIETAEHRHEIAILKRNEARAQLKNYTIAAPFEGIVTRINLSAGEAVRQGDQILELASTARVRVEGYVSLREVAVVRTGAAVTVQLDIPEADLDIEKRIFRGTIGYIDVKVAPVTNAVRVWAEVENEDNLLRAGLTARLTITPERGAAAERPARESKSR